MGWHNPMTQDDIEAHESHPLLRDANNKKNKSSRSATSFPNDHVTAPRAMSTTCLVAWTLLLLVVCVIHVHIQASKRNCFQHGGGKDNLSTATWTNDSSSTGTSASARSSWWNQPDQIDTTHTYLPLTSPKDSLHHGKVRWGILGLGRIALDFTTALKMTGANITAVAAGSLPNRTGRAKHFAQIYDIPRAYGSYEEMAADPNVDIVYIANIHPLHYTTAMMMLQAGKNVLLEKPMTMNYQQAQSLVATARKVKRLLLTNYWTRFFPVVQYVRSILASNQQRLGPISAMRGDLGFPAPIAPRDRFLSRSSGGGAMLDVGCYLVNLAVMVNPCLPQHVKASAQTTYMNTDYHVDTEMSFVLNWDTNDNDNDSSSSTSSSATNDYPVMFSGQASLRRPSSFEFEVNAQHGRLVIHAPANAPHAATIYDYEPWGGIRHVEKVYSQVPILDTKFGAEEQYPRGGGFIHVIHEIETCLLEQGIPGRVVEHQGEGCLELKQLSLEDQLLTVRTTDIVMRDAGYWDW